MYDDISSSCALKFHWFFQKRKHKRLAKDDDDDKRNGPIERPIQKLLGC